MTKKIETRKDEIRYKTLEPSQMLNKYICKRVVKKWTEELIQWKNKDDEEGEYNAEFVVHTFDVDRALLIINAYLVATEAKRKMEWAEKNEEYLERTFHLLIEKAAPIPVGRYIPKEFSLAYQSE